MLYDAEGRNRGRSYPLGWGIGGPKLRIFILKLFQLLHESVVFGVTDFGVVGYVVEVIVPVKLSTKFFYAVFDFLDITHSAAKSGIFKTQYNIQNIELIQDLRDKIYEQHYS